MESAMDCTAALTRLTPRQTPPTMWHNYSCFKQIREGSGSMAADDKDGLLFSLKELKDIAANEPATQPRPAARSQAAKRPVKKKKSSSLLGDVSSLLADVQETVTADAAAEKARIEAEREAQRLAEEQAEAARRAKEEAEVAARLAAENARQRAAEEEREARRREQDLADRRARGEIIEEDLPKAAPVVAQPAAATPAQVTAPAPLPRRGTGFYLAVIGLPLVCITAVVLALVLKPAEPTKPEIPLAAAQLPQIAVVESSPPEEVLPVAIATEAPAPAAPESAEEDVGSTAKKKKKRRRRRRTTKSKSKGKKKDKLKINLGGGGITF